MPEHRTVAYMVASALPVDDIVEFVGEKMIVFTRRYALLEGLVIASERLDRAGDYRDAWPAFHAALVALRDWQVTPNLESAHAPENRDSEESHG